METVSNRNVVAVAAYIDNQPSVQVPFSKMLGVGSPLVRTGGQRTWKVGSIPARPLAS
jgi:hypothetical protein